MLSSFKYGIQLPVCTSIGSTYNMQIVIGTAGHIDHGKTALVKALTGTNTDRLDEEKARGMTIDLGFAYLNQSITCLLYTSDAADE